MGINTKIQKVTDNISQRNATTRALYLLQMAQCASDRPARDNLGCCNLAHGLAAQPPSERSKLLQEPTSNQTLSGNIAIISAYNDMLSAHAPYKDYPDKIKQHLSHSNFTAQMAAGVPAMCDGITQGQSGMELSLFSRDVIAMSTAVGLSHGMFDGVICLGICDKIVPGLLIGALRFGFLPTIFIPSGPMHSGISNKEKSLTREKYSQGLIQSKDLLASEIKSYHSAGTCTFYGTANTNQILLEAMGLQLPGSSFINPDDELRPYLTEKAVDCVAHQSALGSSYQPLSDVLDEQALVNAMVALLASGGSTNHTIHLIAIAKAAGIQLTWDDFHELSLVVPLITQMYPNGSADVNDFQQAGGTARLFHELLQGDLLYKDKTSILQTDDGQATIEDYGKSPILKDKELRWETANIVEGTENIIRNIEKPFKAEGGIKCLSGTLGTGVIKTSALEQKHYVIKAPARVFTHQDQIQEAYQAGELNCDFVAVLLFQGPKANGMPELHGLTPPLTSLLKKGYQVGLVTDGRMSGASGIFSAAIHMTPEALDGGPLSKIQNGDIITIDANNATLEVNVDSSELDRRVPHYAPQHLEELDFGRELFSSFRQQVSDAAHGASIFNKL